MTFWDEFYDEIRDAPPRRLFEAWLALHDGKPNKAAWMIGGRKGFVAWVMSKIREAACAVSLCK